MWSYSELLSLHPHFPKKSVILVVLLNIALFGALIFYAWDSYRNLNSFRQCLRLSELSGTIDNLDEVLTMSARMAAATGDKSWEERYRNFEPKLNSVIEETLQVGKDLHVMNAVTKTSAANDNLVSMESRAFDLIHVGNSKAASDLLNGPEYESKKNNYRSGMEMITERIDAFICRIDDANYFKNCMLIIFVLLAAPTLIISLLVILLMIKRYEYELKKDELRFQDMSEITNNWIWELDSKMRFTYVNYNVRKFIGYSPEEVLGKTPAELMPHSEFSSINQLINDLMDNPKPFCDLHRKILHQDGSFKTFIVKGIPLYGRDDKFSGYRGICSRTPFESTDAKVDI
jgi:PAS domain S-box-containing protein